MTKPTPTKDQAPPCPECGHGMRPERVSGALTYACRGHGRWIPQSALRVLQSRALQDEDELTFEEGFLMGRFMR